MAMLPPPPLPPPHFVPAADADGLRPLAREHSDSDLRGKANASQHVVDDDRTTHRKQWIAQSNKAAALVRLALMDATVMIYIEHRTEHSCSATANSGSRELTAHRLTGGEVRVESGRKRNS